MRFRIYRDSQGYWRWRLRATNNRIIADSGESYANKHDCRAGVDLVKRSGDAPVDEE
jgi:uncharacterized protein YegP (UPF0339 family)